MSLPTHRMAPVALVALLLSGCAATPEPAWRPADGRHGLNLHSASLACRQRAAQSPPSTPSRPGTVAVADSPQVAQRFERCMASLGYRRVSLTRS